MPNIMEHTQPECSLLPTLISVKIQGLISADRAIIAVGTPLPLTRSRYSSQLYTSPLPMSGRAGAAAAQRAM